MLIKFISRLTKAIPEGIDSMEEGEQTWETCYCIILLVLLKDRR